MFDTSPSPAVALELTVTAANAFWLELLSAVMLSFNKILCIVRLRLGSKPAPLKTTLSPDIAAVNSSNGLFPDLVCP